MDPNNEARSYKAFISYRHLPLDIKVAKKLHSRIERYVIPKALRKDGGKKIGLVFRDQDELPISSDLSSEIETALDHSEYLVVICTPETKESKWVMREITYFLEHHDHDHILVVLAAGSPEESFPEILTKVCDENGNVKREIEPLAANIVADSERKRNRLFKTESLRILATLIGCPYDDLYQRDQRYRKRQIAIASGLVAIVVLGFIGLLINRNRMIAGQLSISQTNESLSLAKLAESEYKEGKYREAVEHLVQALPRTGYERPYVASAEMALGTILHPYANEKLQIDQSITQETQIEDLAVSKDGQWVATIDSYNTVRCYSTMSGKQLWKTVVDYTSEKAYSIDYVEGLNAFLLQSSRSFAWLIDMKDGAIRWQISGDRILSVNINRQELLVGDGGTTPDVMLYSLKDGKQMLSASLEDTPTDSGMKAGCVSDDGRYLAVIVVPDWFYGTEHEVVVYDRDAESFYTIESIAVDSLLDDGMYIDYELRFAPDDSLILIKGNTLSRKTDIRRYSCVVGWPCLWKTELELEQMPDEILASNGYSRGGYRLDFGKMIQHLFVDNYSLTFGDLRKWAQINLETGEMNWSRLLHDNLVSVSHFEDGMYSLLLENGVITKASSDGYTGEELDAFYYDSGINVSNGAQTDTHFEESTIAIIPDLAPNQITIIRNVVDATARYIETSDDYTSYDSRACTLSPSGKGFATHTYHTNYDSDDIQADINVVFLDLKKGSQVAEYSTPVHVGNYGMVDQVALTESGNYIFGSQVITIEGEARSLIPDQKNKEPSAYEQVLASSFKQIAENKVYTAVVWEDANSLMRYALWDNAETLIGELQLPTPDDGRFDRYSGSREDKVVIGGAGYSLVALNWDYNNEYVTEWILVNAPQNKAEELKDFHCSIPTMAQQRPVMAALFEDGLALYDCTTKKRVFTFESDWEANQYCSMIFTEDDRYLIAFTEVGNMAVFETTTGKRVLQCSISNRQFDALSKFEARQTTDGNRLLVFCTRNQVYSDLLVIDINSKDVAGFYTDVMGYCASTDEFMVINDHLKGFMCKRRTVAELLDLAQEYLER